MLYRALTFALVFALLAPVRAYAADALTADTLISPVTVVASYQYGSCRFVADGQEPEKRTGFAFKRCKDLPKELIRQLHKADIDARLVEFDPTNPMTRSDYKQAYAEFLKTQLASPTNDGRYLLSYEGFFDSMWLLSMPLRGPSADHPELGVLVFGQRTLNWRDRSPVRPKNVFELANLITNTLRERCTEVSLSDCRSQGYLLDKARSESAESAPSLGRER